MRRVQVDNSCNAIDNAIHLAGQLRDLVEEVSMRKAVGLYQKICDEMEQIRKINSSLRNVVEEALERCEDLDRAIEYEEREIDNLQHEIDTLRKYAERLDYEPY